MIGHNLVTFVMYSPGRVSGWARLFHDYDIYMILSTEHAAAPLLLATKIHVPRPRRDAVTRARLNERLEERIKRKLTLRKNDGSQPVSGFWTQSRMAGGVGFS